MADFEFACPHCGQSLEGPEEMAGQTIECPACQQSFAIPGAPRAAPAAPAAPACPACQAAMEPGAVLCLQCGFHSKLGKKIDTKFG